jgi:hypothetical protein
MEDAAMILCPVCGRENHDRASFCLKCRNRFDGGPASTPSFRPDERDVGIGLGLGIFFLPLIFAWFTLRAGHSSTSRVVAFVWLGLSLVASAVSSAGNATHHGSTHWGFGDDVAFMTDCTNTMDRETCTCAAAAYATWPSADLKRIEAIGASAPVERWPADLRRNVIREMAVCAQRTLSPSLIKGIHDGCIAGLKDEPLCACIAHDFLATRPPEDLVDAVEANLDKRTEPSTLMRGNFQSLSFKCSKKLGR